MEKITWKEIESMANRERSDFEKEKARKEKEPGEMAITVIVEKKSETVRRLGKILDEKHGDLCIAVITDTDYAKNNGYQNLINDVDMNENNIIIIKP